MERHDAVVGDRQRVRLPYLGHLMLAERVLGLCVAALVALIIASVYDEPAGLRGLVGLLAALIVQDVVIAALRRRIGPERASVADLLTLGRATAGAILAGLVASGVHDRAGPAGWLGLAVTILGGTACDWLDGPLARRLGPTRLGGALDIEADSWLTLWSAAAAVAWGGLPWWALLAPILRYAHPLLDVVGGGLPTGGGPWWSRVSGVAQMALIFAALAPLQGHIRDVVLVVASVPIAVAQCATMLTLLAMRRASSRPQS
jgi:phosphatidylglycerophosphate synthase